MKLCRGLKDYGTWCRKDKIMEINNNLAFIMERKGNLEIIKDLGKYSNSPVFLKRSIESMKLQVDVLKAKIKLYEKRLEGDEK